MRIALINGGVVANLIEADLDFAQTLGYELAVADPDHAAVMHGMYANGVFAPPPAPPAPPEPEPQTTTVVSKLTFLRRLTQAERIAIRAARATDPVIEDAESLMQLADNIDVTDPDTVGYVGYLAHVGLIDPARVADILAPEPV